MAPTWLVRRLLIPSPVLPARTSSEPDDDRIGQYRLVRRLGQGGMGEVHEAVHVRLGKRVAIKLLQARLARFPEAARRLHREGVAACRVRHPAIVDVTDVGVHRGRPYLVMELLEGQSLEDHLLSRDRPGGARDIVDLLLPVVSAVAAAHRAGVTHRDIKPANIILVRDRAGRPVPKVVDFGISRLAGGTQLTRVSHVPGTPSYMAPELRRGSLGGAASDQYALGVTLFEALTGVLPDAGGRIVPLQTLRPDLPRGLVQAVTRAMRPDPDGRHPSVRALGHALLPFASARVQALWARTLDEQEPAELQTVPRRPVAPRTRRGPRWAHRVAVLALCIGVALLAVTAWHVWTEPPPSSQPALLRPREPVGPRAASLDPPETVVRLRVSAAP